MQQAAEKLHTRRVWKTAIIMPTLDMAKMTMA